MICINKFNIPGPDINGHRTGRLLDKIPAARWWSTHQLTAESLNKLQNPSAW